MSYWRKCNILVQQYHEKFSQCLNDIEDLKDSKDFFELEMLFDGIMQEMGNELLNSLLASKSKDRRK